MPIRILPGFSIHNKEWAEQTKNDLSELGVFKISYWPHWQTGNPESDWIVKEAKKVMQDIGMEQLNIIAKSIGTVVAMKVLNLNASKIGKLILCGIPIYDLPSGYKKYFEVLRNFPSENVLIIQNKNDNHGKLQEVKSLIDKINPKIVIASKPRSDHEYYYSSDFENFLK